MSFCLVFEMLCRLAHTYLHFANFQYLLQSVYAFFHPLLQRTCIDLDLALSLCTIAGIRQFSLLYTIVCSRLSGLDPSHLFGQFLRILYLRRNCQIRTPRPAPLLHDVNYPAIFGQIQIRHLLAFSLQAPSDPSSTLGMNVFLIPMYLEMLLLFRALLSQSHFFL